ncbi:MAG: hypothetical protein AAFX99_36860, partial [Myxococcota bacterium]
MNDAVKTLLTSITSATVVVILMASYQAIADGDSPLQPIAHQIPYQGYLERDGLPVNAVGDEALPMTFTLYQGDDEAAPMVSAPRHGKPSFECRLCWLALQAFSI